MNAINGLGRRQVHECPVCGKRCRGTQGLKMHIRDMHTEEPSNEQISVSDHP